jgi:hypothetical protein
MSCGRQSRRCSRPRLRRSRSCSRPRPAPAEVPPRRGLKSLGFFEFWPKTPGKTPAGKGLEAARPFVVWASDPARSPLGRFANWADGCCGLRHAHANAAHLRVEGGGEARDRGMSRLTSARLPVTPTIALALLAELILVETRSSQLLAHLLTGLPLTAHLTIAPTITLTLLAQAILVFAGEPQLFALASASPAPTIIYADAAGSDLKCLSRDRGGYNKCRHGKDEGEPAHGTDPCWGCEWQRFIPCRVPLDVLTPLRTRGPRLGRCHVVFVTVELPTVTPVLRRPRRTRGSSPP